MEDLATALIKALSQQGPAYTLLGLAIVALAWVATKWQKAENKCFELSSSLNEKRITEKTETIAVLHAGAEANKKLADSIIVRTETLNNLITVITSSNDRTERKLDDNQKMAAEILRWLRESSRSEHAARVKMD